MRLPLPINHFLRNEVHSGAVCMTNQEKKWMYILPLILCPTIQLILYDNYYSLPLYVTTYVWVLCPCSGVPGLLTKLEPTLHIALFQVNTMVAVGGKDADEPDTSKRLHVIVVLMIATQDHQN